MRSRPDLGPRYWAALCLASIFGCNTGDALATDAGLGHWRGLPLLAGAFALTLLGERRVARPHEAWYWLAIVIVRTAATNLADLVVHDAGVPYPMVFVILAAVILVVMVIAARRAPAERPPVADGVFWTGMLAAGILGTACGDDLASARGGFGLDAASIATSLATGLALAIRATPGLRVAATFWTAVVVIRTAGTNLGDLFAHHITLNASTVATGATLAILLLLWPSRPRVAAHTGVQSGDT